MQRIRIKFTKGPETKFISHLDMIRAFERAIRRSTLPIAYTSGYNPRIRISWGPPLAIGIESVCELADLYIDGWIKPDKLKNDLNSALPHGFEILETKIADPKEPSLDSSINRAEYSVLIETGKNIKEEIDEILKKEKIEVEKKDKIINKKPMLYELNATGKRIKMILQVGSNGTMKPKEILDLMSGIEIKEIKRMNLFVA